VRRGREIERTCAVAQAVYFDARVIGRRQEQIAHQSSTTSNVDSELDGLQLANNRVLSAT